MNWTQRLTRLAAVLVGLVLIAGCGSMRRGDIPVTITGAEEVPPVRTSASGVGSVRVSADRTVTGSFRTQGGPFTAAHIHEGAPGQNGPIIITLLKTGENDWIVPPDAKLNEAQYENFKAGRLYVNFHSAEHKGGEIRAQIRP